MTKDVLNFVSTTLDLAGINYEFGEWTSDIVYPYFVGEYQEISPTTEDGLHEATFILVGFSRGSWLDLENAKEKIERVFSNTTAILDNGSGLAVFYAGSMIVPTGDAELKRIEIRLDIKEWKVN
jgi:hypothetical protein